MSTSVLTPPATAGAGSGSTGGPAPTTAPAPPSSRPLRTARRLRVPPSVVLAALALLVIVAAAVFPEALAPHDPLAVDPSQTLAAPSAAHPLGTDENGRDVLSRIVHGTRNSLLLGFGAITIGLVAGTVLGLLAGLGNRWVDAVLMRTMDVGLAFPELLLALVVIAIAGGGTRNALLAIGIASTPSYARLVRAQTLGVRRAGYVEAARDGALGVGGRRAARAAERREAGAGAGDHRRRHRDRGRRGAQLPRPGHHPADAGVGLDALDGAQLHRAVLVVRALPGPRHHRPRAQHVRAGPSPAAPSRGGLR